MSRKNPIHNGILTSDLEANGHKIIGLQVDVSSEQIVEAVKPELDNLDERVTTVESEIKNKASASIVNLLVQRTDALQASKADKTELASVEARVTEIEENASAGGVAELMTPITHAELLTLRNSSQLVPGMQYRITDYVATTKQSNTKSANHPFDIIVTADDEDKLNEVARAIRHEGDTYFANCKLESWKIWYCLDNDTNRFAWATSSEKIDGVAVAGKGVIYRMIDEWDNDVPYDFKGILTKAYIDGSWSSDYRYTFGGSRDETVKARSTCYSNKMGVYITSSKQQINQNTFESGCSSNTFENSCSHNTFASDCSYNIFGNSCSDNTFGDYCSYNIFGNGCSYNIFGNDEDNPLDHYQYITFGNGCKGLNLYCTASTSWEQKYKNVEIKSGVTGDIDEYGDLMACKTITDDNVNQSFHTTYKPVGSMEVSV